MTRSAARRIAPAVAVALALLVGGCSSNDSTGTSTGGGAASSAVASASSQLCEAYATFKTDAGDMLATKIDSSAAADQFQQQVDELQGKADKVRDDLNTLMMQSQGGPAAEVIGQFNQKADALRAEVAVAKTEAQEQIGPKITAAQEEAQAALEPVTAALDKLCASS
jgi:hypothetical protein